MFPCVSAGWNYTLVNIIHQGQQIRLSTLQHLVLKWISNVSDIDHYDLCPRPITGSIWKMPC